MQSLVVAYVVSAVGIAILARLVLARDRRAVFYLFSVLSLLLSAWLVCQMLVDLNIAWSRFFVGVSLLLSDIIAPVAVLFAHSYPSGRLLARRYYPYLALPLLLIPFSFSPLLLGTSTNAPGGFEFNAGPLYLLQTGVIVVYVLVSLALLLHRYVHSNAQVRGRISLLFMALAVALVGALITGTILSGSYVAQIIRPLSFLAMVAIIAYAIIRHKLFDIRLAVARSLGYTFTLVVLAAVYGFVAFGLARVIFRIELSLAAQVYLSVAMAVASISFPALKRFFDRITNAVFYRDAYDPQELLDDLAKMAVSSLDIRHVVKGSTDIIASRLKVAHAEVVLSDEEGTRLYGTENVGASEKDVRAVYRLAQRVHANTILTDELDEAHHAKLHRLLRRYDIAAMVQLVHRAHGSRAVLGYIVLGPKRSGNMYTQQDVKVLEAAANELVLAIQNALQFGEIQQFNKTLQQRVDDATAKLRQANERLKVLNETKDDFVSMASHQLRTPLTSIKGYLSMVLEGDMGKITAGQRTMIEQAFTSSQRMAYLISDLLNMSRLRTGRLTVTPGTVSLNKIIDQEIAQLKRMAEGGNVKLIVEEGEDLPPVALDETKIRQVIMNLVDNAIYYTGRGGTVTVRLSQTPKTVELRVIDTGIGVPVADQHKLFTRFYRASNAKKVRPDGTGIGLYMVRKVVTALGGSIIFTSKEGKGSTFGFSFPKVAPKVLPTVTSAEN